MNEQEFWAYFEGLRKEPMYPEICDRLPQEKVVQMGELLLAKQVSQRAKITIMMTLAHQQCSKEALRYLRAYNQVQVDPLMKVFAEVAVYECKMRS